MTDREPWLGHRDLCPLQWGEDCDCPNGPEYLTELEIVDEVDRKFVFNGDEADEVWMDRP